MTSFLIVLCSLFFSAPSYSFVGKIIKTKGQVKLKDKELILGDQLRVGDIVKTYKSSMAKIRFIDQSTIVLGPSTEFKIEKFLNKDESTDYLQLIKGKIRAHINKENKKNRNVSLKAQQVSIGVRGTNFLVNLYPVKGAPTTDVLLAKGRVETDLSRLGVPVKSAQLEPAQLLNSHLVKRDGNLDSIKTLSQEYVDKLLKDQDGLIPNFLDEDGNMNSSYDKSVVKTIKIIKKSNKAGNNKNEININIGP